jgi:AraC-like DNA-binding protein
VKLARDIPEFLRAPLGRAIAGPTFLIWCRAPDLAGSIQWGAPDERDVAAMMDALEFIRHRDLAAQGAVLMDCRAIERVDAEVLIGFTKLARERLPRWSPRIRAQAVVVPDGVAGILLAGALPVLGPAHPFRFVADLEAAFAFLDHPDARAAFDEATAMAEAVRGSAALLGRVRAQLARDLAGATIDQVAAALGMSARSLQRELQTHGTSFTDELRRARVTAAEELLRLSDQKIEAIAARVGFGSSARLNAALRRELGAAASEIRARKPP